MEFLDRNQTWTLADLPKDSKIIGCRRVFHKKNNKQYKARFVAKRYAQKEGIDYNKIFSPIINHISIWMLLVIITPFDLKLEQMGVKITF